MAVDALPLQQSALVPHLSRGELLVLLALPLLGGGVVLYLIEDVLGYDEDVSFGAAGALLVVLALGVEPALDVAVAVAVQREFGWRVGFQVGRPLTYYWGLWGVMLLVSAYDERTADPEQ